VSCELLSHTLLNCWIVCSDVIDFLKSDFMLLASMMSELLNGSQVICIFSKKYQFYWEVPVHITVVVCTIELNLPSMYTNKIYWMCNLKWCLKHGQFGASSLIEFPTKISSLMLTDLGNMSHIWMPWWDAAFYFTVWQTACAMTHPYNSRNNRNPDELTSRSNCIVLRK
jgi:hypothetical protein